MNNFQAAQQRKAWKENTRITVASIIVILAVIVAVGFWLSFLTVPAKKWGPKNAQLLALACRQYAADHGGAFPPSLQDLRPRYLPAGAFLYSPTSPNEPDYIYHAGLRDSSPAKSILIEDKNSTAEHLRIVVRVDGSVDVTNIP